MGSSEVLQVRVCMGSDLVDMGSTALVDLLAGSAHAWQDRHDSTCVRSKLHPSCAFTTRLLQASVCLLHECLCLSQRSICLLLQKA